MCRRSLLELSSLYSFDRFFACARRCVFYSFDQDQRRSACALAYPSKFHDIRMKSTADRLNRLIPWAFWFKKNLSPCEASLPLAASNFASTARFKDEHLADNLFARLSSAAAAFAAAAPITFPWPKKAVPILICFMVMFR